MSLSQAASSDSCHVLTCVSLLLQPIPVTEPIPLYPLLLSPVVGISQPGSQHASCRLDADGHPATCLPCAHLRSRYQLGTGVGGGEGGGKGGWNERARKDGAHGAFGRSIERLQVARGIRCRWAPCHPGSATWHPCTHLATERGVKMNERAGRECNTGQNRGEQSARIKSRRSVPSCR